MGIIRAKEWPGVIEGKRFNGILPQGAVFNDRCFYCGQSLCVPDSNPKVFELTDIVFWAGHSVIFLHPECVEAFTLELIKDLQTLRHDRID
jgi:hypothetical protein